MKKIIYLLLFILSTSAFSQGSFKAQIELSPVGSFEIKGKRVKGHITKAGSSYTADKISISVKSLKSGIDLRDEHMLKRFTSKKIIVTEAKGSSGKGECYIEINGIKKKTLFTFKDSGSKALIQLSIKLSDFKFKKLKYLGVKVQDMVKIKAKVNIL